MKIAIVGGARPNFIKIAPLVNEIEKRIKQGAPIEYFIIHTGQHFDKNMSEIFFKEMQITSPKYFLNINGLSHGAMTGQMLEKTEEILLDEKPDYVVVFGDTNTTLAGALAAKKIHQKVVHIESGLRSYNMAMPEEINRIMTDRISDYLFCPTHNAVFNLEKEGYDPRLYNIIYTGDIMYDAYLHFSKLLPASTEKLEQLNLESNKFILTTIHRAENANSAESISKLLDILNRLSEEYKLVFPIHPRTKNLIEKNGLKISPNVVLLEPLGYLDMLYFLKHCGLVLTDSGGVQKEAYFSEKFCITMRKETEWIELLNEGVNFLVNTDYDKIKNHTASCFGKKITSSKFIYGNGNSSEIIINCLE